MTETAPNSPRASAPPPQLGRVAFHAVASGLTPLIPVPFLDDFALSRVREQMVRDMLKEAGLPTPAKAVAVLAGSHLKVSLGGRLLSFLKSIALFPVRKVFRRVFFVLWVKDCVDVASQSLHQGYLLQHALARGDLDAGKLEGEAPRTVQSAIHAACREQDTRIINQLLGRLFKTSKLLVTEATQALLSPLIGQPRVPQEGEQAEVRSLADRLAAELWEQRGYFTALEQRYEKHLAGGKA
jgi:hypothetical protein